MLVEQSWIIPPHEKFPDPESKKEKQTDITAKDPTMTPKRIAKIIQSLWSCMGRVHRTKPNILLVYLCSLTLRSQAEAKPQRGSQNSSAPRTVLHATAPVQNKILNPFVTRPCMWPCSFWTEPFLTDTVLFTLRGWH